MKCTQCKWHNNKYDINAVQFSGNPNADIVFMGGTFTQAEAISAKVHGTTHFPSTEAIGYDFNTLLKKSGINIYIMMVWNQYRRYNHRYK